MIVSDASAAVAALLGNVAAQVRLSGESVHAPHLIDFEVASAFRRAAHHGDVSEDAAREAVHVWTGVGIDRHGVVGLLGRMWELRHNLSPYDAGYVALAEALECPLLTANAHIAAAPGIRCEMQVIR